MNPIETDRRTLTEFIRPREGKAPLIRVIKNSGEETVKAQFALCLSGVDYRGNDNGGTPANSIPRNTSMRYASSMFDGLKDSHSLEILCCAGKQGFGNEWRITGSVSEKERNKSIEEAMDLFENVSIVLKTMHSEYQFAAVNDHKGFGPDRDDYLWSAEIEPARVMIFEKERRPIGFAAHEPGLQAKPPIILPMMTDGGINAYLDSLYCSIPGDSKNVRLVLRLEPIRLHPAQRASIEDILNGLKTGRGPVCTINDGKEEQVESRDQVVRIVGLLEPWVKDPSGYHVRCAVQSDEPLPTSLLSMIGREVFREYRISTKNSNLSNEENSGGAIQNGQIVQAVDLGCCFHKTAPSIPLFPSLKVLADAGFRRQYSGIARTRASDGILLGRCGSGTESEEDVYYPLSDRERHCVILGASGSGKSTLQYNMLMQDIRNGEGAILLDPHGDLYSQVLESIPENRYNDVVLVNPCDFEYTVGINFLECSNGPLRPVEMNFITNELIRILDRIYDLKRTGGPMFEQYMRNALALLMDADPEQATLIDVPCIFEDDDFRTSLIRKCENQLVKNFWTKQALQVVGEGSLCNMGPYITSKLNQFTTNALLRPIIGQSVSTINFRSILDEGRILLVNLSKGFLGELDSQLLGMLIIGKIFGAAMSRFALPVEQRRRSFLYIDEFGSFASSGTTLAHMLSEIRKYGVCLTAATQNLSQLASGYGRDSLLDSVLGNMSTLIMFRIGVVDSARMHPYVKPYFSVGDLQELPDFHAIARMLVHNLPQRPFVFRTIAMNEKTIPPDTPRVIDQLRRRCSRPRREVEQQINERLISNMRQ